MSKQQAPNSETVDTLVTLFEQKRYVDAERLAQKLSAQFPRFGFGWKALGTAIKAQGRSHDALPAMRRAASLAIDDDEAHFNLAITYRELGLLADAEQSYRCALKINPYNAKAHNNLGVTLKALGQIRDSELSYLSAIQLAPDFVDARINLGTLLYTQGRLDEAIDCLTKASQSAPASAQIHLLLANALADIPQLNDAETHYRRAVALAPKFAEAHYNFAVHLQKRGQLNEAVDHYQAALAIHPHYAEAHENLGVALSSLGDLDAGLVSLERARLLHPANTSTLYNIARNLHELYRSSEAEKIYRQVIELAPDFAEAHYNLGLVLFVLGRYEDAEKSYRQAIALQPAFAQAHSNLGNVLKELGQPEEAVRCYRQAIAIDPTYGAAYSNLLFALSFHSLVSPKSYLEEARHWSTHLPAATKLSAFANRLTARSSRRLKIGYVSGDFRQHAVSFFFEPVLKHHNRQRIEIFLYPTSSIVDTTTERLKSLADHWTPLTRLDDEAAQQRVIADGIDVLIDLSGHTAYNRLGLFARRAAPVQCHYLGYFASTGLPTIDYLIADSSVLPEKCDDDFSEKIWRLPRIRMCYQGSNEIPNSQWVPSGDGAIGLGSFNHLSKINLPSLRLWANILQELPASYLLLKDKGLDEPRNRQRIAATIADLGLDPARVELMGSSPDWKNHMALYDRLDIALDPVAGHGGATTTCDALWMGVPVVTKCGADMTQRMTASMLEAIGHSEWVTRSTDDYIARVLSLAKDVELRKQLRYTQRESMAASPLCDAAGLARDLEGAYAAMFETWCQTGGQQA